VTLLENTLKSFIHLTLLAVKQQTTYRTALLAGLVTNLFFGFLRTFVMIALYNGQTEVNQLPLQSAITYVGLTQAAIAFLNIFGSTDLLKTVISGEISADLVKPVDYFFLWLAKDLGSSLVNFLGRGVLFIAVFIQFNPFIFPPDMRQWVFLVFSLGLSWFISFSWRFLVNLTSFWSQDALGIARIAFTISQFLSGFIMPLRLLPDWFKQLCYFTPFPSIINTPVEIYLGILQEGDMFIAIVMQIFWCIVLVMVSQYILRLGFRRLVIQGG
jgi:ABC-2 type transport system permease protein